MGSTAQTTVTAVAAPTAPRRRAVVGIAAILAMVFAILAPAPASATPADESDFIDAVNQTRAEVGLAPLVLDVELTVLARGWAESMRDGGCGGGVYICHASPISNGVTHQWAKLGENVGTGPDVTSVMNAFIASPGHYANIVDPEFTHIGVGVVWDGSRLFTTHRFMKLQGQTPTTTTTVAPTTTTVAPSSTTAPSTTDPGETTTTTVPAESTSRPPVAPARANVIAWAISRLD